MIMMMEEMMRWCSSSQPTNCSQPLVKYVTCYINEVSDNYITIVGCCCVYKLISLASYLFYFYRSSHSTTLDVVLI